MELYFTKEEMIDFLKRDGYTIETIKTWKSQNSYHNQVHDTYHNVEVAYKGTFDVFNNVDGMYRDDSVSSFKIESVFREALRKKLLSL
jgi:hypothetical protein